jgi:hypothetical protein
MFVDQWPATTPFCYLRSYRKINYMKTNFVDWYCNIRIVLEGANKEYVFEATLEDPHPLDAKEMDHNIYTTRR